MDTIKQLYKIGQKAKKISTWEIGEIIDIWIGWVDLKLEDYDYWYIVEDLSFDYIETC